MSFDLSWFTTIPGLFITGGIVLLIIAIIILIATGKKGKKETKVHLNGESKMQKNYGGVLYVRNF